MQGNPFCFQDTSTEKDTLKTKGSGQVSLGKKLQLYLDNCSEILKIRIQAKSIWIQQQAGLTIWSALEIQSGFMVLREAV